MDVMDTVHRYVSVWNEPSAEERRNRIRSLWAPGGTTCYAGLDACGYDAIEARVTRSWDKWLRDGNYIFRSKADVVCHHDVVKVNWEMVTVPHSEVDAVGLSFLVLNSDGRIHRDYQFSPAANDAEDLVEEYLAAWNESNSDARRDRISALWAPDGAFLSDVAVRNGHYAIEAAALESYDASIAKGFVLSSAHQSHRHHNVAMFKWHMLARHDGQVTAAGSQLLVFDENERIRFDYRFDEPV